MKLHKFKSSGKSSCKTSKSSRSSSNKKIPDLQEELDEITESTSESSELIESSDDGPQGDMGSRGFKGAVGAQGDEGRMGCLGAQGPQGDPGSSSGPTGSTGPTGPRGYSGIDVGSTCLCVDSPTQIIPEDTIPELSNKIIFDNDGDCFVFTGKVNISPNDINNNVITFSVPFGNFGLSFDFTIDPNCTNGSWTGCYYLPNIGSGVGISNSGNMYLETFQQSVKFILVNNFSPNMLGGTYGPINFKITGKI